MAVDRLQLLKVDNMFTRKAIYILLGLCLLCAAMGRAQETDRIKELTVQEANRLAQDRSGKLLLNGLTTLSAEAFTSFDQTTPEPSEAKLVQSFLKQHCFRCHDAKKHEADFRIDTLTDNFADPKMAERWAEALTRINAGEMPPKKETSRPTATESAAVVAWIATEIKKGETARMAARGAVAHYRLSRNEYANTVYDLLGVRLDVDAPGVFNDDERWHGFENIGAVLTLSPSHIEKYFAAAEKVVASAFPEKVQLPAKKHLDAKRLMGGVKQRVVERNGKLRFLANPGSSLGIYKGALGDTVLVRMQLSGLKSVAGKTPRLLVVEDGRNGKLLVDREIVAPEDKPIVIEFISNAKGVHLRHPGESRVDPKKPQPFDERGNPKEPLLLIDWIETVSPYFSEEEQKRRDAIVPSDPNNAAEIRKTLHRFLERAWRRPVLNAEVDRYVKIVEEEKKASESFRSAYRAALVSILSSRNFIFIEEGSSKVSRDHANDWELASRLSYMLWGSMPDDELFAVARAGELRKPEVLRKQFARMLADPKITRFTRAFPTQWLQLHQVGSFPPDKKIFPGYDRFLETSMVQETTHFFAEVFRENLPLREFLLSDWTMVDPRLATYYGIAPPEGNDFTKVKLRPGDHRGGVLTHASILSMTSDGTRHRPIHRGVWIAEVMLGMTIPPPPPNVEPLDLAKLDTKKTTIRTQLEAHATNASCAACHRKIDPLGFAFEGYDAIGRWRTIERPGDLKGPAKKGALELPVKSAGELADGRKYEDAASFQKLLVEDIDRVAEVFVSNLAIFALRRAMTVDDAKELKKITQASRRQEYRLKAVIEELVFSELFQKR